MEFRKCPACEASVLEDDAVDCPFCGASMSGKPSGKPAAKPAKTASAAKSASPQPATSAASKPGAKPETAAAAPGRQLARRSSVAAKPSAEDDADPFDVDTSAIAQAPPMAPRPAKGRMIRVVCPMCETPGFISPKMQGRDVKCCNPKCMVPVFKAPRPQRQVEQVVQTGGVSPKMLVGGLTVGLPLMMLLVWYFVLRDSGPKPFVPDGDSVTQASDPGGDAQADGTAPPQTVKETRTKLTLAEIQQKALTLGVDAARERDGEGNRSKPYCRRMLAEAYAQAGDVEEARHQIERLGRVTSEPFYRVEPLVEIAWQQLAAGDRSAAGKTVSEAFEASKDFPSFGRSPVTAVASVGAALAAFDRISDAQEVVRRLNRDDDSALSRERVAALVQIAFDLRLFDLDKMLQFSSLDMAAAPVAIAVTTGVAAQGEWDRAIAWALAAQEAVTQEDCLAAAAVIAGWEAGRTGDAAPVSAITEAANAFSAAGQSRVAAGVATGYLLRDDRESAATALQQALSLLESVPRPKTIPPPDVKRIHDAADELDYGLPNAAPLRSAAVGAAQMARLQVLMGDQAAAWTTFLKAWEFTQGMGPEWATTSKLADEIANNRERAEQRVRRDLGISTQDLATRAFHRYARSGRKWGQAADDRFQLEVSLLKEAITWKLLDNVAGVLKDTPSVIPSAAGQRYRSTSLVSTLAEAYAAVGNDEKSRETAATAGSERVTSEPIAPVIAETERLFRSKKYIDAAKTLGTFQGRHDAEQLRDLRAMQLACRMLKLKQPDTYFPFILALKDPVLTEDCLELTAALAVREGLAPNLWERFENERLTATQRVAFFRGLIAGIASVNASGTPADAQTAASDRRASKE